MLSLKNIYRFSFYQLAGTLETIQKISSSLQKKNILSNYIKKVQKNQKVQIAKIFEFVHKKTAIGINSQSLINYYSQNLPNNSSKLNQNNNNSIDSIIQVFDNKIQFQKKLQISEINQALKKLVQTSGKNSQKTKLEQILSIMIKLSKTQAKFFLRIITKNLRIGMKEKLILAAFNQSNADNNDQKIQQNMQVEKQEKKQRQKQLTFSPMLARPIRNTEQLIKFCQKKSGQLIADVKYDGQRSLIYYQKGKNIKMISRNGKQQNQKYYKIASGIQKSLQSIQTIQQIILDGQIMSVTKQKHEPLSIQILLSRRRKHDSKILDNTQFKQFIMDDQNVTEIFYCFDVLQLNRKCLYQTKLIQRKKIIQQIEHSAKTFLNQNKNFSVKSGQYKIFKYPDEKQNMLQYFTQIVTRKYQGLILKGVQDFYYSNGTRVHWGKLKKGFKVTSQDVGQIDLDLILMGADRGKGKNQGFFSSFLLGTLFQGKIHPISKVGTGFTEDQLKELTKIFSQKSTDKIPSSKFCIPNLVKMDVYFQPFYVIQVKCQQFSRSPLYSFGYKQGFGGISLRFPVFDRIRDDKNIQDSTNGVQILSLIESK